MSKIIDLTLTLSPESGVMIGYPDDLNWGGGRIQMVANIRSPHHARMSAYMRRLLSRWF